jgi:hypothetical protein
MAASSILEKYICFHQLQLQMLPANNKRPPFSGGRLQKMLLLHVTSEQVDISTKSLDAPVKEVGAFSFSLIFKNEF